ncbi:MAG TPA: cyclodeaminase/cyclohydrolase family protein [Candidatus Limnocylindria bacterium]|nr:cyclodeaminase/cyclohydrolase family protein [Candidatus Limnocylindria bacterium]
MEGTSNTSLTDLPLRELLARLATRDPVPGGGSAAALAGAMGAALVSMVTELTIGRPDAADHEDQLLEARSEATSHLAALLDLADEDAAAYHSVVEARRLPRTTDEEQAARLLALNSAMHRAAEAPLRTAQTAARVLDLANGVAPIGNLNAVSDAGVAALLAAASVRGAALNVRINLPYLPAGDPLGTIAPEEVARLEHLADELERSALDIVARRMARP